MEIAFALFIAWAVITLVGHASWVIVKSIFRALASIGEPPSKPPGPLPTRSAEFEAARRVIRRMRNDQRLSEQATIDLLRQIRAAEFDTPIPRPKSTTPSAGESPDVSARSAATVPQRPSHEPQRPSHEPQRPSHEPQRPSHDAVRHQEMRSVPRTPDLPPDLPPVSAPVSPPVSPPVPPPASPPASPTWERSEQRADEDSGPVTAVLADAPSPELVSEKPVLSASEVIQSFLSAHNIRWGELIAGVLIVVCSIGLVISLWSPLVEKHRVVPSLIFLGANSAIYAAGLYTLSRWRLRHTSRAVLVIATLLVPLSVLAGLAAAGTERNAVMLNDPITLIAIAAASLVYLVLLYLGGKALSRKSHALPLVLTVAGPVSTLPLVPAMVRTVEANAGWLIAMGSASVIAAVLLMTRRTSPKATSIGPAGSRVRLLVMGFGGFSLAVSVAYLAFFVRGYGRAAMLPLAVASIPAVIALAGMARMLMLKARSSTLSMASAVTLVLLVGLTWTVMPPSMVSPSWLWMWALSLGLSALAIGFLFRQPNWLGMATLPIGMAAVLTSKVWIAGHQWSVDALWTRVVSGEAMIASMLVASVCGATAWALSSWARSQTEQRRVMERSALGWGMFAFVIATILAFAPVRWLGVVPAWVVTLVMLVSVLASFFYSLRDHRSAYAATFATSMTWLSIKKPTTWFAMDAVADWMLLASAVAGSLLLMVEVSKWLTTRNAAPVQQAVDRSQRWWVLAANGFAIVAALAAVVGVETDWIASSVTLSAVALLALWASSIGGSVEMLRGSQLATAALAAVIGYAKFSAWLLGPAAWSSGKAMWGWAIAAGLVATLWWLIREAARFLVSHQQRLSLKTDPPAETSMDSDSSSQESNEISPSDTFTQNRIGHLVGPGTEPLVMPDGWLALLSTALTGLAAAYFFATLAIQVGTSDLKLYDASWGLPLIAIGIVGLVSRAMRRHEHGTRLAPWLTASVMITAIVWLSCQLSGLLPWDASSRLILATTIASATFVGVKLWADRHETIDRGLAFRQASLVVTVFLVGAASTALLRVDWFDPIVHQQMADRTSTISVALWWLASSLGLLWKSKQVAEPESAQLLSGTASVILFSAAAAIVVPAFRFVQPPVWIQVAALAAMGWIGLARWKWSDVEGKPLRGVIDGTFALVLVLGVINSVSVTASIIMNLDLRHPALGPAGFLLSLVSSIGLSSKTFRSFLCEPGRERWLVSWPVGVSLMAGQIGWLFESLGWISGIPVVETVVAVWVASALAALTTYRRSSSVIDFVHIGGVAVVSTVLAILLGIRSQWMPWLAMSSLVAGGIQVALIAMDTGASRARSTCAHFLGWFVGGAGAFLLMTKFANQREINQIWTMLPLWLTAWVVSWRLVTRESSLEPANRWRVNLAVPDVDLGLLLMVAAVCETAFFAAAGHVNGIPGLFGDPLFWTRVVAYVLAAGSAVFHATRGIAWTVSISTLVAATSLTTVKLAIELDASSTQRVAWGALSTGFVIAMLAHWLPGISRSLGRATHVSPNQYFDRLVQATWLNSALIALVGILISIGMIAFAAPPTDAQLAIATVALAAWAIAEMADESDLSRLRHVAVGVGLSAIGLWASVDTGATDHPVLAGSMRWLVASVLMIPMLAFVAPKLLGRNGSNRWADALRRGTEVSAATALGSLVSMLTMEFAIRSPQGISGMPLPIVVVVAITLAILSVLSGVIAVVSGPTSKWRDRFDLSDRQRFVLISAAQVIGVLTWLHVYLCEPDWLFESLRVRWPYVVMALSFVSVGITEWARRRGDEVMSQTLKQTALYLPLIPVLGFWLSGSVNRFEWMFAGGQVRYDVLLVLGTIYYLVIAMLWKGVMPRVTAIVLGNAAWWVVLTQWPGWEFLSHPQLWLIPPAVCVLVVAQLYSRRLDPHVASAIRYASTLVIYISSTADMLLQQIGTTLSGPIILIVLALFGMLAGVVLRVRPFLYLGATFVFLGVTSMVWHAQRAFDSVWPWWVFGISTGLCLLMGLMAIEKHKSRLRDYANQLASWEQ